MAATRPVDVCRSSFGARFETVVSDISEHTTSADPGRLLPQRSFEFNRRKRARIIYPELYPDRSLNPRHFGRQNCDVSNLLRDFTRRRKKIAFNVQAPDLPVIAISNNEGA